MTSITAAGAVEGGLNSESIKSNFINKINEIRDKMPTTQLSKRGNMAMADVDIPGIKDSFVAHSGINSKIDKGAELPCCQSCSNIILEFRRMYPNIRLKVNVE